MKIYVFSNVELKCMFHNLLKYGVRIISQRIKIIVKITESFFLIYAIKLNPQIGMNEERDACCLGPWVLS